MDGMKINGKTLMSICPTGCVVQQWKVLPATPLIQGGGSVNTHLLTGGALYHKTLQVDLKFRRKTATRDRSERIPDRDKIELNISKLIQECTQRWAELELETEGDRYTLFNGILQNYKITPLIQKGLSQKVSLTFRGYFHGEATTEQDSTGDNYPFEIYLTNPALVSLTVENIQLNSGETDAYIYGFVHDHYTGEDSPIIIPNASQSAVYKIDGITGEVSATPATNDVPICTDYPVLVPEGYFATIRTKGVEYADMTLTMMEVI